MPKCSNACYRSRHNFISERLMITVFVTTESHFPVEKEKIKEKVTIYLQKYIKSNVEVNVSIVGDRKMSGLNRIYRKKDGTTPVLAFSQSDETCESSPFISPPNGILHLGDIVISYPQARLYAEEENSLMDDMIIKLAIHGVDSLLGR